MDGADLPPLADLQWDSPVPLSRSVLELKQRNLSQVLAVPPRGNLWPALRSLLGPKPRPTHVDAATLRNTFESRMNPPSTLPEGFNPLRHAVNRITAWSLPRRTLDTTEGKYFSKPFTVEEVDAVKGHIRAHCKGSATGLDGLDYSAVLDVPSDCLRDLFQRCIDDSSVPQAWLTAIIAAVKKPAKDPKDPASYRTIGLESCFLKALTLLIDRRLRDWAETTGRIPDSQSGFRKGHRTVNNAFVLRSLIDKAHSLKRTLYVIFLDLTNAFPSVDQPTLWIKLLQWGASGPLIDWLRMLYSSLRYVVRHNNEHSEVFTAAAGILTGDPASPILWLLLISDFRLDPHPDDVHLAGTRVSNMELADDMTLVSLSPAGAQDKLNQFSEYTANTFVLTNIPKTLALAFGPLPNPLPIFVLRDGAITLVDSARYTGVHFSSTHADIFTPHYARKELAARGAANAALSIESHIGAVPAATARTLYYAHVEPHLTFGCEVAVDVRNNCLKPFEDLQRTYLRRLLGVSPHSQIVPLYTETGIWPIRYRRMELVLQYATYVVRDGPLFPRLALQEAVNNARDLWPSWWGDIQHALAALPAPVQMRDWQAGPTLETLAGATRDLSASLAQYLHDGVMASSRLPLVQARVRPLQPGTALRRLASWRPYLDVQRAPLRAALARLVVSEHPLAVETLRHSPQTIPRHWRICRMCGCRECIEDECHVLFLCEHVTLAHIRQDFFSTLHERFHVDLVYLLAFSPLPPTELLVMLLERPEVLPLLAEYVDAVFHAIQLVPLRVIRNEDEWMSCPSLAAL